MHAMCTPGSGPGRIIEVITPGGGFENYFRELGELLTSSSGTEHAGALHESSEFCDLADEIRADIWDARLDGRCGDAIRADAAVTLRRQR